MTKMTIRFSAWFNATIEVEDPSNLQEIENAISGIDIPENEQCKYAVNSFNPEDPIYAEPV